MLDIKWIRENPALVQTIADQKGISISISGLIEMDDKKRVVLREVEQMRQDRNRISGEISINIQKGELKQAEQKKQMVKKLNNHLNLLENDLKEVEKQYKDLMMIVPNIVSADTPVGLSDQDNVEMKRVGKPVIFNFEPKDHVLLGELHKMIDLSRGVKTAGSRNYYLTGIGVALHRAVQQLALDVLVEKGFTLLEVPLMVRTEALFNTGFFPLGEDQTYKIAEEDKWLVGTSEVSLVSYYDKEIVDVTKPIKLAAASTCFRNEVGSAGRDTHGLYRVHQFSKVEQVIICENSLETSEQLHTAVASPRILIPLLENHQEEDGSIRIPQALRKYMNGMECIRV